MTLRRILFTWTGLWDFPPRWKTNEPGLPNVLCYSFVTLIASAGLYRALQDRPHGLIPLLIPLIVLPIAYYLTHSEARYRHPADPMIVAFTAYAAINFRRRESTLPAGRQISPRVGE
jgi:hypothetical protein